MCSVGYTDAWSLKTCKTISVYVAGKDHLCYEGQSKYLGPFFFNFTRKLMAKEAKMWLIYEYDGTSPYYNGCQPGNLLGLGKP